jgi:hypothetical protein
MSTGLLAAGIMLVCVLMGLMLLQIVIVQIGGSLGSRTSGRVFISGKY